MKNKNILLALGLILLAVVTRLVPHYPNFTAVGAMALFAGATLKNKPLAFALPLVAFWLSDLVINNVIYAQYTEGFAWFTHGFVYQALAIVLITLLGGFLSNKGTKSRVVLGGLLATVLFFLVSNFGVWQSGTMYPHHLGGLMAAYTAGIPFALQGTLLSTVFYSAILFGVYDYLTKSSAVTQTA